MSIKQSDYEILLSAYSSSDGAIALLKHYRPYLELLPSLRRPNQSTIAIPLPIVRIRNSPPAAGNNLTAPVQGAIPLPCDLAILTCDPEWKIKMGVEILVYIHRPQEDFSALLGRWRQTQVWLDRDYEWLMPHQEEHMLSEGTDKIYPLFVIFDKTIERIKRGLAGAHLPFVLQASPELWESRDSQETVPAQE